MTGNFSFLRAARPICFLLAALAATAMARAQTPPSGIDEATGMDYACEGALGYVGCANLNKPQNGRPLPPPKPDVWGAIAVAPNLGWGTGVNKKTKQLAQSEALQNCKSHADGTACKIVTTVADVCVALAFSAAQKIYAVGGPTGAINFAESNAKLKCQQAGGKSCAIVNSFCADGVNHMLQGQTVFSNGNPIFVPQGSSQPFGRR